MSSGVQNDPGTVQQEAGFGFNGRFWNESYSDGLTALAGGAQANATQLASMFNTVTTVTTPGDSVQLPPATTGACVGLENSTANSLTCWPQNGSSDTINGYTAANSGVQVAPYAMVFFICTKAGVWYAEDLAYGAYINGGSTKANLGTVTTQTGVSAAGVSSQANATQLTAAQVQVSTVAASTAGVKLPPSQPGLQITIVNNGANTMNVYPASGEQINSSGANTAVTQTTSTVTIYLCFVTGNWVTK
jgi:hypothetical protein